MDKCVEDDAKKEDVCDERMREDCEEHKQFPSYIPSHITKNSLRSSHSSVPVILCLRTVFSR